MFQTLRWVYMDTYDIGIWAEEADALLHGGSHEFDFLRAYGHPGGPVLEGTIVLEKLFPISYVTATAVFTSLCIGLLAFGVCVLSYRLRKDFFIAILSLVTIALNWMYQFATPPSGLAAAFAPLLFLYTLYIWERTALPLRRVLLWGVLAGAYVATRADVGTFFLVTLIPFVFWRVGLRSTLLTLGVAGVTFFVLDPFMWFMPLQHMYDLWYKIAYHYKDMRPIVLKTSSLVLISVPLVLSAAFALVEVYRKRATQTISPVLLYALIGMTIILYLVYGTSRTQEERYYMPIIFIWEILLPFFIVTGVRKAKHRWVLVAIALVYTSYHLVGILVAYGRFLWWS